MGDSFENEKVNLKSIWHLSMSDLILEPLELIKVGREKEKGV